MDAPQPDPWLGRSVGDRHRYRIDRRLDKGGMGDVFLAMDTLLGQQVALKLLKDTLVTSAELKKRFEREVALSASLRSDHIVHVSDYGVTAEGHPFYVMEYLRGESLGQLLRREKRLSIERTVGIVTQVCEGLRLAHKGVTLWRDGATVSERIKVVHRDLKPANIFLVPTALGELVKILDFGIAKKIYDDKVEQTALTSTFLGTFRYAAPEQLEVEKDLDERADIYSLGIILYEMLSGADPFGFGIKARSTSGVSWAMAHSLKPPKPLRSQPGCEQLPPELEEVVLRCLQKAPAQRFASVEDLSRELQSTAQLAALDEFNRELQAAAIAALGGTDIAHSPSPHDQGSMDVTVVRPLVGPNQGVPDATVAQMPPAAQGSNSKTVSQPLAPAEDIADGTIAQNPYPLNQETPDETIIESSPRQSLHHSRSNQPLTPSRQGVPDRTIAQVPSPPSRELLDSTIVQSPAGRGSHYKPSKTPIVAKQEVDTTIAQVPSPPSQGVADKTIAQVPTLPSQHGPDRTIAQTPSSSSGSCNSHINPLLPINQEVDATIAQIPPTSQEVPDRTIAQVPRSLGKGVSDRTIAQTPSPKNKVPDTTFAQISKDRQRGVDETVISQPLAAWDNVVDATVANVSTPSNPSKQTRSPSSHYFLPVGVGIAVGLAVASAIYTYAKFQPQDTQVLADIRILQTEAKYEECIAKAETVTQDSSLYSGAQRLLNQCRMEQAKKLAAAQNFKAAITVAEKIPQNSSLHPEAQPLIEQWSQQIDTSI